MPSPGRPDESGLAYGVARTPRPGAGARLKVMRADIVGTAALRTTAAHPAAHALGCREVRSS